MPLQRPEVQADEEYQGSLELANLSTGTTSVPATIQDPDASTLADEDEITALLGSSANNPSGIISGVADPGARPNWCDWLESAAREYDATLTKIGIPGGDDFESLVQAFRKAFNGSSSYGTGLASAGDQRETPAIEHQQPATVPAMSANPSTASTQTAGATTTSQRRNGDHQTPARPRAPYSNNNVEQEEFHLAVCCGSYICLMATCCGLSACFCPTIGFGPTDICLRTICSTACSCI